MTPNLSFPLRLTILIVTLAQNLAIPPTALSAADSANPLIAGELRVSSNPHYFQDASGTPILLNGSQTWNTFQDWGIGGTIQALDFDAFVKFLTSHGHNFTLLWTAEMPRFSNLPYTEKPLDFTVTPLPWMRTGPGKATDGGPKFDLTKFDPGFFQRLRTRVRALDNAGIYAGVYLFTGEFLNIFRSPSDGYPLTGANNINGVDDGYTGGKRGIGAITMTAPNAITKVQDAYVERVIDALNDLPNVLWIVSEEAPQIRPGGMITRLHISAPMRPASRTSTPSAMPRSSGRGTPSSTIPARIGSRPPFSFRLLRPAAPANPPARLM